MASFAPRVKLATARPPQVGPANPAAQGSLAPALRAGARAAASPQ